MPSSTYKAPAATILSVAALLYAGLLSAADPSEDSVKYVCISEYAAGLIYRDGRWESTAFQVGRKFTITMVNGALVSVKNFGAPDEETITFCRKLEPTESYECASNFDAFRFQPSTNKFVFSETSGYTTEFEDAGLPLANTTFTPSITLGRCEKL